MKNTWSSNLFNKFKLEVAIPNKKPRWWFSKDKHKNIDIRILSFEKVIHREGDLSTFRLIIGPVKIMLGVF